MLTVAVDRRGAHGTAAHKNLKWSTKENMRALARLPISSTHAYARHSPSTFHMASCRMALLLGLLLLVVASPAIADDDSGIYYQLALMVCIIIIIISNLIKKKARPPA